MIICLRYISIVASVILSVSALAVIPAPDGGYPGHNTAEGEDALFSLATILGFDNTALGFNALYSSIGGDGNTALGSKALFANTTGGTNTAVGAHALDSNTTGLGNTAAGCSALSGNTTASSNTAAGDSALASNTTGDSNTAIGNEALRDNRTAPYNTANGSQALESNASGSYNTAEGVYALHTNESGNDNTAIGPYALFFNVSGAGNIAAGRDALHANSSGSYNIAIGEDALSSSTAAANNTAVGYHALDSNSTGNNNTAYGNGALDANTTGSGNSALGDFAGSALTTGSNNITLGNNGVAGESGSIRIGAAGTHTASVVAGIRGTAITGTPIKVTSTGQLGTSASSKRFKENIVPMEKTSEAIYALRPVTFRYKPEVDPRGAPQFGLIAEEVEKVNADLVERDSIGRAYTVRYEAVNAMLLNEFVEESRRREEQENTLYELKALVAQQKRIIRTLDARIRKRAVQLQEASEQLAERTLPTSAEPINR